MRGWRCDCHAELRRRDGERTQRRWLWGVEAEGGGGGDRGGSTPTLAVFRRWDTSRPRRRASICDEKMFAMMTAWVQQLPPLSSVSYPASVATATPVSRTFFCGVVGPLCELTCCPRGGITRKRCFCCDCFCWCCCGCAQIPRHISFAAAYLGCFFLLSTEAKACIILPSGS